MLRTQIYNTLAVMLPYIAPTLTKDTVSSLNKIMSYCCEDLLPAPPASAHALPPPSKDSAKTGNKRSGSKHSNPNADTFTSNSANSIDSSVPPDLHNAASTLLPIFISLIPSQNLRASLRAQLDRTAILTGHKQAMLAAVLNVPHRGSGGAKKIGGSIMPHLARASYGALEVEALLRPRMPVFKTGGEEAAEMEDLAEEMDEDEDAADVKEAYNETLEKYRQLYTSVPDEGSSLKRSLEADSGEDVPESTVDVEVEVTKRSKHTHDTPGGFVATDTMTTTVTASKSALSADEPPTPAQSPSLDVVMSTASPANPVTSATVTSPPNRSEEPAVNKTQPAQGVDSPKNEDSSADDDEDEDDDFEIPVLNMDPDTEDESGE